MEISEFLEQKNKLDEVLSYITEDGYVFIVFWEHSQGGCPVHDGFYDVQDFSYSFNVDELLSMVSSGLNEHHVRAMARLEVSQSKVLSVENIHVRYESSGHAFVSITVDGMGKFHDCGDGTKRWNKCTG